MCNMSDYYCLPDGRVIFDDGASTVLGAPVFKNRYYATKRRDAIIDERYREGDLSPRIKVCRIGDFYSLWDCWRHKYLA